MVEALRLVRRHPAMVGCCSARFGHRNFAPISAGVDSERGTRTVKRVVAIAPPSGYCDDRQETRRNGNANDRLRVQIVKCRLTCLLARRQERPGHRHRDELVRSDLEVGQSEPAVRNAQRHGSGRHRVQEMTAMNNLKSNEASTGVKCSAATAPDFGLSRGRPMPDVELIRRSASRVLARMG
jgi:hypothetical protein